MNEFSKSCNDTTRRKSEFISKRINHLLDETLVNSLIISCYVRKDILNIITIYIYIYYY